MDMIVTEESQRMAHYQISGYEISVRYMKVMGHKDIVAKLQQTFNVLNWRKKWSAIAE